ncbi:unnamed protein product [Sphagnum balticum]
MCGPYSFLIAHPFHSQRPQHSENQLPVSRPAMRADHPPDCSSSARRGRYTLFNLILESIRLARLDRSTPAVRSTRPTVRLQSDRRSGRCRHLQR